MGKSLRVSVLIASFNVAAVLDRCLRSLAHNSLEAEVIVVDNASGDDTLSLLARQHPHVCVHAFSSNRGFATAINHAARHASGDHFLILNPDTELPPDALIAMCDAWQRYPDAAVMGFRQIDGLGRFQPVAHGQPVLWRELWRRIVQRHVDRGAKWLPGLVDRATRQHREVTWVSGSAMWVRRDVFESVNGFDETFFLYFEDVDFCLRVRAAGGRVVYAPAPTLVHHRGASARMADRNLGRVYRQSQLYFSNKHHGPVSRRLLSTYLRVTGRYPDPRF